VADAIHGSLAIQQFGAVTTHLLDHLTNGDVVIVFSAGDATKISAEVFQALQRQEAAA
jgi:UDP-N-acetylmuramate-alanine ligase